MRDLRAGGSSNLAISRALRRSTKCINAQIGRPAPRPPASTARGRRKQAQRARERLGNGGRGSEMRPAEHGYALPAGSPLSWGAISDEAWPGVGAAS